MKNYLQKSLDIIPERTYFTCSYGTFQKFNLYLIDGPKTYKCKNQYGTIYIPWYTIVYPLFSENDRYPENCKLVPIDSKFEQKENYYMAEYYKPEYKFGQSNMSLNINGRTVPVVSWSSLKDKSYFTTYKEINIKEDSFKPRQKFLEADYDNNSLHNALVVPLEKV